MDHVNAQDSSYPDEYVHSNLSQYVRETHFCLRRMLFLLIHESKIPSTSVPVLCAKPLRCLCLSSTPTPSPNRHPALWFRQWISPLCPHEATVWEFDKIKIEKNCKDLFWKTFFMLRAIRRKAEEIFEKCTIMQFWHCGFCLPYEKKTPRPSTNAQSLSLLGASDLELEKSTICVCTAACFRPNIFHVFAWSFTKRTKIA